MKTCDWDRMVTGAKDLSAGDMDAGSDSYRNADFKWNGALMIDRDSKSQLERSAETNARFDRMMNEATDAGLVSFVAEVCENIAMLFGKYLGKQVV
jgi:hypothetical protein